MKKGTIYEGTVCCVKFPNKGIVKVEGEEQDIIVKHVIPEQKVKVAVNKVRKGKPKDGFWKSLRHRKTRSRRRAHISDSAEDAPTRAFRTKSSWNSKNPRYGNFERPDSGRSI